MAWKDEIRAAWDAGLSIDLLCDELGVTPAMLARWAAGEKMPREGTQILMRSAIKDLIAARTAS